MPVISFASSKGGAGKTTACIVLGTELSRGTTVYMIDADPAERLVAWAGRAPLPDTLKVIACADEKRIQKAIADAQSSATVVLVDLEGVASRLNTFVMAKSNLVIIPMGDEQQDADAAIDTLSQVRLDGEMAGRDIPARVLFARTKAAVKSGIAKDINKQMRAHVPCFEVELKDRSAYSNLHNMGGTLQDLEKGRVGRLDKAIDNAQAFAAEVIEALATEDA